MLATVAVAAPEPQLLACPMPEVPSLLTFPQHAHPQLRKSKSNHVLPVPKTSAPLLMLSPRKSPTKRDAKRLSTNTAPESSDTLDVSSNVKPKLKLMLKSLLVFPSLTVLPLMLMLLSPPPLP